MMRESHSVLVQTGPVPALLFAIRQTLERGEALTVLALDVENVRQYLREIPGLQVQYFQSPRDAVKLLEGLPGAAIFYLAGPGFRRLRRNVTKRLPQASALSPDQSPEWSGFLNDFYADVRRDSLLLVQSDSREMVEEYVSSRLARHRFQRPSISLVCREEERPYWMEAHPDWRLWTYGEDGSLLPLIRRLRRQNYDATLVFFTGHLGYPRAKWLALLAGARQCSVVDERGGYAQLTPASLLQFGVRRRRNPAFPKWDEAPKVLVVLKGEPSYTTERVETLRSDGIFRSPRFSLMTETSRSDAPVDGYETIPAPRGPGSFCKAVARLRRTRFDVAVLPQGSLSIPLSLALALGGIRRRLFMDHPSYFFQPSLLRPRKWVRLNPGLFQTTRVLLIQTCHATRMSRMLPRLAEVDPFYQPEFSLLTREADRGELEPRLSCDQVLTYPDTMGSRRFLKLMRDVRRLRFDSAVLVLSPDEGFGKLKCLSFLAGIPHKLLFNRNLDCFSFTLGQLFRYLKDPGATRVLVVQTWDDRRMRRIFERLEEVKLFRHAAYSLFVREDHRSALEGGLPFEQILTYPVGVGLRDSLRCLAQVRSHRFDAAVVAFTGERSFLKLKWLPTLTRIPRTVVFNRNYDYTFLSLRLALRHWLRRPVGVVEQPRVLVIQTWDDLSTQNIARRLEALEVLVEPTYSVFVREDKQNVLRQHLPDAEIVTYPVNAGLGDWWRSVAALRRQRYDVAVVAFTGESSFQKLKLLPFAAGIRHKLVFNRHYDCFFFSPLSFVKYLGARYGDAGSSLLAPLIFPLIRACTFPFRFAYLLLRVTGHKVQRAARLRR